SAQPRPARVRPRVRFLSAVEGRGCVREHTCPRLTFGRQPHPLAAFFVGRSSALPLATPLALNGTFHKITRGPLFKPWVGRVPINDGLDYFVNIKALGYAKLGTTMALHDAIYHTKNVHCATYRRGFCTELHE